MLEIQSLFPSPVFSEIVDDLDSDKLQKDKIIFKKIEHQGYNNLSEISEDKRILEKYLKLKKGLLNKWQDIAYNIFNYENDFEITTSWITRTKKGTESSIHLHKNSFFSGIFYYGKYTDASGGVVFYNPLEQYSDYFLIPNSISQYTSTAHKFNPKTNLLLFFPSLDSSITIPFPSK